MHTTPLFQTTHKLTRSQSLPQLATTPSAPPTAPLQRRSSFSDVDTFERAPTLKPLGSNPTALVTTAPHQPTAPSQPTAPALPAVPPIRYSSVSASSAHHDRSKMKQMAPTAAAKSYGFSFVDKRTEAADIQSINAYIKHVNGGGSTPMLGTNNKPITHKPADHDGAKPGMIQFDVNGRTYSTHADTAQLFPVKGEGIVRGKGIQDMHARLKDEGVYSKRADVKTYYSVNTALDANAKPWASAGRAKQDEAQRAFNALMGFK